MTNFMAKLSVVVTMTVLALVEATTNGPYLHGQMVVVKEVEVIASLASISLVSLTTNGLYLHW